MTAYREIFPRDEPFTGPGESGWAKQTADEQAIVLVAEGDGVVGFVAAGPSRDPFAGHAVGEIYALYVARPATGDARSGASSWSEPSLFWRSAGWGSARSGSSRRTRPLARSTSEPGGRPTAR